jgi:Predicted transcriptional regulators
MRRGNRNKARIYLFRRRKMEDLKIVYLNVDELTPYSKNAKKYPKKQIQYIANSIEQFGMNDPIGIWSDKNIIIEGHGRLEACKLLGYTVVPCIRLDNLSDEQRKAYTLAHNKVAESDWDFDLLNEELEDIFAYDMQDFGFEFIDEEKNKLDTQDKVENILNLGACYI